MLYSVIQSCQIITVVLINADFNFKGLLFTLPIVLINADFYFKDLHFYAPYNYSPVD